VKYNVRLVNNELMENVQRGFWEQCLEAWCWRVFKKPDGTIIDMPKTSILYMIQIKK
jgi:hypothetical protein